MRSKKTTNNLYLFYGKAWLLIKEAVCELIASQLEPQLRDFNLNTFDGADTDAATIIATAETLPVMAPRRLIVIRDAEKLDKASEAKLADYVLKLPSYVTLIFTTAKCDYRRRLYQVLRKKAKIMQFDGPKHTASLVNWVQRRAKANNRVMAREAAGLLIEFIGDDLSQLANEIAKLSYYVLPQTKISSQAVATLVANSSKNSIFQLTDALSQRDVKRSLVSLQKLMAYGEPETRILYMLARELRLILMCKLLAEKGYRAQAIASELNGHGFVIRKCLKAQDKFSYQELARALELVFNCELGIKSGAVTLPRYALESLVINLCMQKHNT